MDDEGRTTTAASTPDSMTLRRDGQLLGFEKSGAVGEEAGDAFAFRRSGSDAHGELDGSSRDSRAPALEIHALEVLDVGHQRRREVAGVHRVITGTLRYDNGRLPMLSSGP